MAASAMWVWRAPWCRWWGEAHPVRPGHITLEDLERALGEEVEVSKAILEKLPEGAVVRSPGMKYKHYAPKADVTLLNGTFEQFKAYVDAHKNENPSCLCFTGESAKLDVPAWNTAARGTVPIRQSISSAAACPG